MKNWSEKTLDELGYVSRGRSRHRPRDAAHLYGGEFPFIQTGDIKHSNLYITEYSQTYSEAGLEQSRLWKAGTLCITIAANIADTAILSFDACFPDSVIGFIADEDKADTRFIKYLFDTLLQKLFQQFSQGAAQDNLSQEKLLSLKFPIPDLKTQRRIADIISTYNELIENNRRRIDLLEQSARMLYKEWFVSLRFPGHEHVKVKDGVPQGWEKAVFADIGEDIRDSVRPEQVDPQTPYIGLEHMPRRSITLMDWGSAEDVTSNKFRFVEGDILFGKIRPYFHKVGFALTDGITSSDTIVMRPTHEKFFSYLLMTASSDHFVKMVSQTVKEGSKMPRANWDVMQQYPVFIPPDNILYSFSEVIKNIVKQLKALALQNQKLQQARDLLLPRLMNGEIPV